MNLFFDTSALVKKYIHEKGSDKVAELLLLADAVYVSPITEIETYSTFKRLLVDKSITRREYEFLIHQFETDYIYYSIVEFNEPVSSNAKLLINKYQLKSLDSIQLGSVMCIKHHIDHFVVCDKRLIQAATREGLEIVNPDS